LRRYTLATSAAEYGTVSAYAAAGATADMELECITPGHGVGVVPVQVALAHTRIPSRGALTFQYS
jgi:hypothetical protein